MRVFRLLIGAASMALLVFLAGFLMFANKVMRFKPTYDIRADGIVVLTGGKFRILEAINLLEQGRAKRLLISGVSRRTSRDELRRLTGHGEGLFDCCIDIGYQALNTVGNAEETRNWAKAKKFNRLIIVTSNYHMPRSLVELGRVLPEADLRAFAVVPHNFQINNWWRHPGTTRLLLSEYVKYLPAVLRAGFASVLRPLRQRAAQPDGSPKPAKNQSAQM